MISRATVSTFKIDTDTVQGLIDAAGLTEDLTMWQRPRSVKFLKRYSGSSASHGISRSEARQLLVNRLPKRAAEVNAAV